jgi:glycosyltransferase involved in cell wall biosynthesis
MGPLDPSTLDERDLRKTAAAVALNKALPHPRKQLLVDISYLVERDTRTGVQRVVYKVLNELLRRNPSDFLVEPVYFDSARLMRYARQFCWKLLGLSTACPPDDLVESQAGDIFLGLDLAPDFVSRNGDKFVWLRNRGVQVHFVVYDLLPVLRPECFDPEVGRVFEQWAKIIAEVADGALCISRSVADELTQWLDASEVVRYRPFRIGYFHLGADMEAATTADRHGGPIPSTRGDQAPLQLLMVSTIEPRKGHAQTLDAFELLWSEGSDARLVIVGKAGWLVDRLIERIRTHPEFGHKLIWIDHADDAELIDLYRTSSGLLVASEGEGFGLPLIEAAYYGLPVICRDIPIFREVAGEHASYFDGYGGQSLAEALRAWMSRWAAGTLPDVGGMPTLTWQESTRQLLDTMFSARPYASWSPGRTLWFPAFDRRLQSEVGELYRGAIHSCGQEGLLARASGIRIPRGQYRIRVLGRLEGGAEACRFELWAGGSRELLKKERLQPSATLLLETVLELNHDARDVEFAVWVGPSARVDFIGVELHPGELDKPSP